MVSELACSVSLLSTQLVILMKKFVNIFCLELFVLHLPYDELLKTFPYIFLYAFLCIIFQLSIFSKVSLWHIFLTLKSINLKYTISSVLTNVLKQSLPPSKSVTFHHPLPLVDHFLYSLAASLVPKSHHCSDLLFFFFFSVVVYLDLPILDFTLTEPYNMCTFVSSLACFI